MNNGRYLEFMQNEASLSEQERISASRVPEYLELIKQVSSLAPFASVESYILKNVSILFNYAPHTTLQIYLSLLIKENRQFDIIGVLNSLNARTDMPAKAYSIINSYISVLKSEEQSGPSTSFASDEKILQMVKEISPEKITSLTFAINTRLQTGEKTDHFVDLLNPYMMASSADPLYKVTLLIQMSGFSNKNPASKPFTVYINGDVYYVTLDGSLDPKMDPFLRAVGYYGSLLKLPPDIEAILNTFAQMYRTLHYNYPSLLSNEKDVKAFSSCFVEAYNKNLSDYGQSVSFPFACPEEYKTAQGYIEAGKFMNLIFKARF